jgi:adhesin transport system membrane fusion protein
MKKPKKQSKLTMKTVKKPLGRGVKKRPAVVRSRVTAKKIAPKKTRAIVSKKLTTAPIEGAGKIEKEFHQELKIASKTKAETKIRSLGMGPKWQTLVAFLTSVYQGIWLVTYNLWRLVKLLYTVLKLLITSLWRLTKVVVPVVVKGLFHLALEFGRYVNIYVPKLWHFLKVNVPVMITWLEKEIPIFLLKLEAWLKKYTPIAIDWIEEKAIFFYGKFKSYVAILFEKIKALIITTKKNYPTYKKIIIQYLKLGIATYKKHRPLAYKNIKSYFEIKDHPEAHENLKDFVTDADHYILHQEPVRGMLIIRVALISIFVLIIWAALTQVDELVKGDGKVVPSSQLQVLQSLDGGIVKAILVREGDEVTAGQALVEIDTTRFVSSVKENDAQRVALGARAERINALLENRPFIIPKNPTSEEGQAYNQEQRYFVNAKIQLDNQVAASAEQLASAQRELRLTKPLLSSGAVSEVEILRLEREVTRLRGLREQAEFEFKNNLRKELSDTMAKLNSLSEGSVGLEDRVKQSVIRSPLNGYVKRLHVNTVGGVIGAAKDIVEVVPSEDNLSIEAKVQPKDIGFLRVGQRALVKLTAYDFSIYGGMEAVVDSIGADSITDEKGNAFYIVKIKTHKLQLKKNLPIIPGMQAEVDIQTGSKSILTYLLKPILRAKQIAFTER